jgi:hypothetical protein
LDSGAYDPLLGFSYTEIAGMSRSMHRSQGMGAPERRGPSSIGLAAVAGEPATHDIFDGIDITWNRPRSPVTDPGQAAGPSCRSSPRRPSAASKARR